MTSTPSTSVSCGLRDARLSVNVLTFSSHCVDQIQVTPMPQTPSINGTQEDFVQFGEFGSDAVKVGIIAVACQSIVYGRFYLSSASFNFHITEYCIGVYAMLFMLSTYILL